MLSIVNVLLLTGLGMASWIFYNYYQPISKECYQNNEIDLQRELLNYDFESEEDELCATSYRDSLILITICIFALAKVIAHAEENTLKKLRVLELRNQLNQNLQQNNNSVENSILEVENYIEENQNLRDQIEFLSTSNIELKKKLRELEESNHLLTAGYDDVDVDELEADDDYDDDQTDDDDLDVNTNNDDKPSNLIEIAIDENAIQKEIFLNVKEKEVADKAKPAPILIATDAGL